MTNLEVTICDLKIVYVGIRISQIVTSSEIKHLKMVQNFLY